MSEHIYARVKKTGGFDIDNVEHLDSDCKQITLASEIKTAFPGMFFTVSLHGLQCFVDFDDDLDAGQIATLDAVVAAHKAHDTPPQCVIDHAAREAERQALRDTWDGLAAVHPYITGPFQYALDEVNLLLDQNRDAEAQAVVEFADPPSGYDAAQLATFDAVKAQMLAGLQGLTIP